MKIDSIRPSSVILQTFFQKFDLFADATDAVARMRELVRHLAVTGKLVGQDPSDESGELLLKEINAERLAAVKARQISPMKPLPAVGEEELLFELQPGWTAARLIELVMEIQTGPFGNSLHKSDYQLGGIPVINPASLKDGKIVPIDKMAIGHATLKRLEVFKLDAGDIVMARRGEMGRCAIVTKNEAGWLCGTGSLVLRTPRSLFAPYLAMLIGAPMSRTYRWSIHITASVFINDDESGLHHDYEKWLERLAPHQPVNQYLHNVGEDNADAHMKRQIMGREVVVAVTGGRLDFGTWERIFYGEFDGRRRKRVLVKIIGE